MNKEKEKDYSRLLDRAGKGDQEAFTEIYEATSQAIYRTVHAMVRDEELTLDIQQETYIQAFTHLDQLSSPDKLLPWLRAIAVNQTRTAMRKRQPILFSELSEDADAAEPEFPDERVEASPELSLDRKQTAELVRELLEELTDAQRMLVGMYYYEQIPVRQIAADLGVSDGAVKTQLSRSRKKIETGVKLLEQRGVKLYGAAPMPFLLALLSRLEPAAEESEKVLAGALTRSGAAKAAALHLGRRFTETAAGKVLLGLLAAGVIGGGATAYSMAMTDRNLGDIRPTDTTHAIVMELQDSQEDLPTVPVFTTQAETELTTETDVEVTETLTTEPGSASAAHNENPAGDSPPSSEQQQEGAGTNTEEAAMPLPAYLGEYLYQYNKSSPVVWTYSFACDRVPDVEIESDRQLPIILDKSAHSFENGVVTLRVTIRADRVGTYNISLYGDNGWQPLATIIIAAPLPASYPASPEDIIYKDTEPQVILWSWSSNYDYTITDPFPEAGKTRVLFIIAIGQDDLSLSVDNPEVLEINRAEHRPIRASSWNKYGLTEHRYTLTSVNPGDCTITCTYSGKQAFSVRVTVPGPVQETEPTTEPSEPVTTAGP